MHTALALATVGRATPVPAVLVRVALALVAPTRTIPALAAMVLIVMGILSQAAHAAQLPVRRMVPAPAAPANVVRAPVAVVLAAALAVALAAALVAALAAEAETPADPFPAAAQAAEAAPRTLR